MHPTSSQPNKYRKKLAAKPTKTNKKIIKPKTEV